MADNNDPSKDNDIHFPKDVHDIIQEDDESVQEEDATEVEEYSEEEASKEEVPKEEQKHSQLMEKMFIFTVILQKFRTISPKKMLLIAAVLVVVIFGGYYFAYSKRVAQQQQAVAEQVLTYATAMQDIKIYIGNNLQIDGPVSGKIDAKTDAGSLTIPVKGTKGAGILTATVVNDIVSQLSLSAVGKQLNVLKDQTDYENQMAAEAALKEKQIELQNGFNAAVIAMQNKNYDAAINGFQNSIANNYELEKSYEYLGFTYSQVNQYDQCISSYQQYVSLKPTAAEAYYQMAYCQLQIMQTNDALNNLTKSCNLSYMPACQAATQIKTELSNKPQNQFKSLNKDNTELQKDATDASDLANGQTSTPTSGM